MRKRSSISLTLCAMACATFLQAQPHAEVLSSFVWTPAQEGFGGLSGLEVSLDGSSFVAVNDDGVLYRGGFLRDANGRLTGARLESAIELVVETGDRPDSKRQRDMEGLVTYNDGAFEVSAENNARLLRYAADDATPSAEELPDFQTQSPSNVGFEALALSSNGQLIVLREGSANIRTAFDVYRRNGETDWDVIYALPRRGGFRPVGADFGPDGHLYVLTRAFNGFGFAARIERIRFDGENPLEHERIFDGAFGQFDNLEGIAGWRTADGNIRLIAISDDNFSSAQSTIVVEFQLYE